MTLLDLLFAKPLRARAWALRREDPGAFRRAWREARVDIDKELRLTGMRWECRDVGICLGRDGVRAYRTNRLMLQSHLSYRKRFARTPCEQACYLLQRQRVLRRMAPVARGEAERRWRMLDEGMAEYNRQRWDIRDGPRMKAVWVLVPYGHTVDMLAA